MAKALPAATPPRRRIKFMQSLAVLAELNISPLERSEKLSLEQFAAVTGKLGA